MQPPGPSGETLEPANLPMEPEFENHFLREKIAQLTAHLEQQNALMAQREAQLAQQMTQLNQREAHLNQQSIQVAEQTTRFQQQLQESQAVSKRLPPSIKLPAIDKYSGDKREDILAWLFKVNEQITLSSVQGDDFKIAFAGTALIGNAATWYRAVKMTNEITTWDDFQTALKSNFYPIDPVKQARDQLHILVQSTSVRDYTANFRHLCTIIGKISEEEKLDRYVRGLKTRTRFQVELKQPSTFDEACRLAEIIDVSNDRIFSNIHTNRATQQQPQHHKPRRDGPVPMEVNTMPEPKEKPKFKKLTPEEKERRRREGLCVYCGSDKHQLEACPLRKPQGKGPQRPNRGA